eukprot:m.28071 g.28071  ORF g.28071 m.28071 type:complete len:443 (-) comp13526_c1_seq2:46-1374(-)
MGSGRGSNAPAKGAKGIYGVQSCSEDGVNFCGRFAALCGICSIAMFAAALMTKEWSKASELGTLPDGLSDIRYAQFGLREFCFETNVTLFEGQFLVCVEYTETIDLYDEITDTWANVTGCERFPGVCDRSRISEGAYAVALLLAVIGAVLSEKTEFNALFLGLAGCAAMVGMSAWVNFQEGQEAESGLKIGFSLGLAVGGMLISWLGTISAVLDMKYTEPEDRVGFAQDGISVCGRIGSMGIVAAWVLLLLAVTDPAWSQTDDLGIAGGLCDRQGDASCGDATFGLWKYSIQSPTPILGGQLATIELEYDEIITVVNGTSADGNERFTNYDVKSKRLLVAITVLISIVLLITADVYSEKLLLASILCLIAALSALVAMSVWVSFQTALSEDTGSKLKYASGGWMCVGSWLVAAATSILYCCNSMQLRRSGGGGGATAANSDA